MSDENDDERGDDESVDATGADRTERKAKDELFEAIDHFKNAASILFDRAAKDPALKSATKEAGRIAKKIGDAAEPLAKQLTTELGKLTKDVMEVVEGKPKKKAPAKPPAGATDEEE